MSTSHSHTEDGFFQSLFNERTELWFAAICGLALAIGFGFSFVATIPLFIVLGLYLLAYFFGGFFTLFDAWESLKEGKFDIDFLMLLAAVGAGILGEWAEGALLLFLFSLGHALEHYAMGRARKSIAALADLSPSTAIMADTQAAVAVEDLQLLDRILIRPNSKIPADGVVVKGQSSVNQAAITGESMPVDKFPWQGTLEQIPTIEQLDPTHRVFAGTLNGNSALEVLVKRKAEDSTLSRLIQLVREAEQQKSPTQHLTDRIERYYVPAILILVLLLNFAFLVIDEPFRDSFYRAMAVLVAASPCALAISTPSAVLSGVGRAARGGVLIKGGRPLEELGELNALAMDKTGTLTEGKPKLNEIFVHEGTKEELLQIAMSVERLSDHPLAAAVVNGAQAIIPEKEILKVESLESITGRGVRASVNQEEVLIGNKALFTEYADQSLPPTLLKELETLEANGNTSMIVRLGERYLGILGLMDLPRPAAKEVLVKLRKLGIKRIVMLTGDNQQVAEAIAKQIDLSESWGNLLPEDKVKAIEKLRQTEGKVAMVGDGVNDAPAMARSSVGIAMGAAGSDVALETADIALMADNLQRLPFAIGLSRMSKRIIRQNLFISMGMIAILVPITMMGIASMGPAVIMHEGSTLLVVLNALRLLSYRD
ncbi:MAG: heavy metal translocating P-type ATPase [Bacteroidia bacterium]